MDNNTLLFQDKGSGRFKDVKIYPNRIEVFKKGALGGKHTEIVYLKDIAGDCLSQGHCGGQLGQGSRRFPAQSAADCLRLQTRQPRESPGIR